MKITKHYLDSITINYPVKIFKSKEDFDKRNEPFVNGVSQEFLDSFGITLEELSYELIGCNACWNSINCINSSQLIECTNMTHSYNCQDCIMCEYTANIQGDRHRRFLNGDSKIGYLRTKTESKIFESKNEFFKYLRTHKNIKVNGFLRETLKRKGLKYPPKLEGCSGCWECYDCKDCTFCCNLYNKTNYFRLFC